MTQQYLRNVSVVIATSASKPLYRQLEVSELRCVFQVRRGDFQTPNSCDLRIYNMKDSLSAALASLESVFETVTIKVSYGNEPLMQIFTGEITQGRYGRLDQRDSYVDITAADGDKAYNFAAVSAVAATANPGGIAALLLNAIGTFGVTQGWPQGQNVFPTPKVLPRGRVLYGSARDELRDFSVHNDLQWSIQDSTLEFVSMTALPKNAPIHVLNSSTGLIGTPEQVQNGIAVKCLLNPTIKIGSLIKLDRNENINKYRYDVGLLAQKDNYRIAMQNKVSAAGTYYVMTAEHAGDTRGTEWYTTLICLAVDATLTFVDLTGSLFAPDYHGFRY